MSATGIWYRLVTFGAPSRAVAPQSYLARGPAGLRRLIRAAQEVVGTGSCTTARVVECETRAQALAADISVPGGVIVWAA